MDRIEVRLPIKLGQFIKLACLADTGSQARDMIEMGDITVDGVIERRRGYQLQGGEIVALMTARGEIAVEVADIC